MFRAWIFFAVFLPLLVFAACGTAPPVNVRVLNPDEGGGPDVSPNPTAVKTIFNGEVRAGGKPMVGVQVEIVGFPATRCFTDASGAFRINVPREAYGSGCQINLMATPEWNDDFASTSKPFLIAPGNETKKMLFELDRKPERIVNPTID